jgi:hypothetical protein
MGLKITLQDLTSLLCYYSHPHDIEICPSVIKKGHIFISDDDNLSREACVYDIKNLEVFQDNTLTNGFGQVITKFIESGLTIGEYVKKIEDARHAKD